VGPGWNAIGAGEPALPGIALGHNEHVAFGFTIVGIDQADIYVERLNPANPRQYMFRGAWRDMEVERASINVLGEGVRTVELSYTLHGPVIHEDTPRHRAYALRWVGSEPGGAGYLAALRVARVKNWSEFREAMREYKVPSENMVYADKEGNIGWIAAGFAPVRRNWSGLLPAPGDAGEYEWDGFVPLEQMPQSYNPDSHFIATANHNILPAGYAAQLNYDWAAPYRFQRVHEVLSSGRRFDITDFQRLQYDVVSIPARRLQAVLRGWTPPRELKPAVDLLLGWDCRITAESGAAALFEIWFPRLAPALFGRGMGSSASIEVVLTALEKKLDSKALAASLSAALDEGRQTFGADLSHWRWGRIHATRFTHPSGKREWHRGPFERGGDGNTPYAAGASSASYRHIIDVSDWDRSVMTNTPGESGDPRSRHYDDLLEPWLKGEYHPMPFSRQAVEAATEEVIHLEP
jgi:penicillin amidase